MWTVKVNVVTELPDKKPSGREQNKPSGSGDIAFHWSRPDEQAWETPQVAGDLQFLKGEDLAALNSRAYGHLRDIHETLPTIVLNRDFPDWLAYRKAVHPKKTDEGWLMREDRYGLALGVTVARLYLNERKVRKHYDQWKARGGEPPEPSQPMTPDQLNRAVAEAARGVIALMPDFDQLLGDLGAPTDGS